MTVDSDAKVTNLNADKLDGQEATEFVRPLWANVRQDGMLSDSRGVVSAQKITNNNGDTIYHVTFDQNVRQCAYAATVGSNGSSGRAMPGLSGTTSRTTGALPTSNR